MKSERTLRGAILTIVDGLKDAQMQYEYAVEAKEEGEAAIAKLHLDEANRRLQYVHEWWKQADTMAGGDAMYCMMMEHYRDWCRELKADLEEMKV